MEFRFFEQHGFEWSVGVSRCIVQHELDLSLGQDNYARSGGWSIVICFCSCPDGQSPEILYIMENVNPIDLVEEAILDFSLGEEGIAEDKLMKAVQSDSECLDGWRALAEVRLARQELSGALAACEKALSIAPEDLTAKVSLSRILVAKGDKEGAEKATAEARILGWKEELKD